MKRLVYMVCITMLLAACAVVMPENSEAPAETAMPTAAPTEIPTPEQTVAPTPAPTPKPTLIPPPSPEPTPVPTEEPVPPSPPREDIVMLSGLPFPAELRDPFQVSFGNAYSGNVLSNTALSWYYGKNTSYQPPTGNSAFDVRAFDGYYLGDISRKIIYLTFDEGYENGFTAQILDVLQEKNVTAAFFVTKSYIERNKELIQRMVDEGHVVGNHSVHHYSSPTLTDAEMTYEIEETARYFKEVTGVDMPKVFRPPMGEYSARTMAVTSALGYKTIFWSFAYQDWLVNEQPGAAAAYREIVTHMHQGAIPLLHAVSQSNTEALPYVIDTMRAEGFVFAPLTELE